jgi:hypothetical protein
MLERWVGVWAEGILSGAIELSGVVLRSVPGMELVVLAVRRPHKPASSPVGFLAFSSAFSSFLLSFSRIRQPNGTSSTEVSMRDLTDVSQAVDPLAARKVDIGLVRAKEVFRDNLTALAIAFAVKLLPKGSTCGSVRLGT